MAVRPQVGPKATPSPVKNEEESADDKYGAAFVSEAVSWGVCLGHSEGAAGVTGSVLGQKSTLSQAGTLVLVQRRVTSYPLCLLPPEPRKDLTPGSLPAEEKQ